MANMLVDGNHKVAFVPAIVNPASPKLTELSAASALDLSFAVSMADFLLGATGEEAINDPPLASTSNDTTPGRATYEAEMNFYRYDTVGEDKAYVTFVDKGLPGFLVRRKGKSAKIAFAIGDPVEVFQIITGKPRPLTPQSGNEKFRLKFHVQGAGTVDRAVVVA